jgi:hypothetical protein
MIYDILVKCYLPGAWKTGSLDPNWQTLSVGLIPPLRGHRGARLNSKGSNQQSVNRTKGRKAGDGLRTRYLNQSNKVFMNRIRTRGCPPLCALFGLVQNTLSHICDRVGMGLVFIETTRPTRVSTRSSRGCASLARFDSA